MRSVSAVASHRHRQQRAAPHDTLPFLFNAGVAALSNALLVFHNTKPHHALL